jgi:hypothetical protein
MNVKYEVSPVTVEKSDIKHEWAVAKYKNGKLFRKYYVNSIQEARDLINHLQFKDTAHD